MNRQIRTIVAMALTISLLLVRSQFQGQMGGQASDGTQVPGGDWGWLCIACMPTIVAILLP